MQTNKDRLLTCFVAALLAGGGVLYGRYQSEQEIKSRAQGAQDADITLPPTLTVTLYDPIPKVLTCECQGEQAIFKALGDCCSIMPRDAKSVWVVGLKTGQCQVMCWTAIRGPRGPQPSGDAVCVITVEPQREPEKKEDKK